MRENSERCNNEKHLSSALTSAFIVSVYSLSQISTLSINYPAMSNKDSIQADLSDNLPANNLKQPLVEGEDYYIEDGLYVFTASFLRARGYCCQSGCRHCPYKKETE